jgi:hypothetical protein
MPGSKIVTLRITQAKHDRWKLCAEKAGLSYNAWAIRAQDETAALEEVNDAHKPLTGFTALGDTLDA